VRQIEAETKDYPELQILKTQYRFIKQIGYPVTGKFSLVKRSFDLVLGLIGIIVGFQLILLFGLLIKLTSKGNIFYTQERVGLMGKPFKVIKLRSMYIDAEKKTGAVWAVRQDPRVTPVGRLMRRTRIDELPQFLNVLKGDMSIVGPRPERPALTEKFSQEVIEFPQRLRVLPGITGYAQINGGYDITPEEKCRLDNFYIDHYSLWFDFKVLVGTIKIIITGTGAR